MHHAKPTKLRNGNWGCRVEGRNVRSGDVVTITTSKGKTWKAEVVKVVWSGGNGRGVSICATRSLDRTRKSSRFKPRKGIDYCGYPCPVDGHKCTADNPCHDCI